MSNETSLPKGAVREAVNVDIDRAGNFNRRTGYTQIVAGGNYHSIKAFPQSGLLFVAQGSTLYQMDPVGYALTPVFALNSPDPVDYTEHDGNIYGSNLTTAFWLPKGASSIRALGVPTPQAPTAEASTSGGLDPGVYTVAVTTLDAYGEESGSSDWVSVTLPEAGGITLSNLPVSAARVRVYMSPPNGEVMYLTKEFTGGPSSTTVGDDIRLKQLETAGMEQMTPGRYIRGFNGRLYTAKDKVLSYSESLRYGLTIPGYNYVEFNDTISFIEPVLDGIFVGAGPRVWFLDGMDPKTAKLRAVSQHRAVAGSSLLLPPEYFPRDLVKSTVNVALWLGTTGYTVGLPGGNIVPLQPDRVRIAASAGRSAVLVRDGRKQVVTPVNSLSAAASGTASDSTV